MNLEHLRKGGINITGFQLLNYTEQTAKGVVGNAQWKTWDWKNKPKNGLKLSVSVPYNMYKYVYM